MIIVALEAAIFIIVPPQYNNGSRRRSHYDFDIVEPVFGSAVRRRSGGEVVGDCGSRARGNRTVSVLDGIRRK